VLDSYFIWVPMKKSPLLVEEVKVHYSIRLVIKIHRWLDNLLCGMALYQIIHFIGIVLLGHQELWFVFNQLC
jgi:hypothetical protein